ncbi:23S rRNA pseudouridine(2604) synthase RluF [Shewanella sp.]|uniref:23S rRNA pseudouridine(2604) synthase RluF n=1 Tax=Shewanella sp. TaxID=50422 RepID=UPI003D0C0CD1
MSELETRLNKYISESGICSRREADRYIEQGNVFINGKRAKIGDTVSYGDKVKVNGRDIEPRDAADLVFIALNKPVGIVSTTEASERDNIVDFVNHSERIFPIGRLDKDSQGLIFLTNNGDLVNKILRAGNNHDKEYLVTVNKPITEAFLTGMRAGVPMLGVITKKCKVEQVSTFVFKIVLVQGLNRQIRRMCEHFNFEVTKLERQSIMNVSLKGLPIGEWRDLDEEELATLFKLIENSSSEDKKTTKAKTNKKPAKKKPNQSLRDKIEGPEHFMQNHGGRKKKPAGTSRGKPNARRPKR